MPNNSSTLASRTAQEAIVQYGITADSPLNSYSAGKPLGAHARKFGGKRLDYIFYRRPNHSSTRGSPSLRCSDCKVVFTETVPDQEFSYSDHFGVEATFEVDPPAPIPEESIYHSTYISGSTPIPVDHDQAESSELSDAALTSTIQALAICYRLSRVRARKELTVFVVCIILLVGLIVGSSCLPHPWISPIFILVTVALSWLGTTMLYEGFIYGNWECNALMNIIEELEIYKKQLERDRS